MKEDENNMMLNEVTNTEYKYGFDTKIDMDTIPKGLDENIIRLISKKK